MSDSTEIFYSFLKVSAIFGMIFTFPNLTDTVTVGLGIRCCVTVAPKLIHVLCFTEFPLAITAFQYAFAFKYCFTPKSKYFVTEVQDPWILIPYRIIQHQIFRFIDSEKHSLPFIFLSSSLTSMSSLI